VDVQEALKNVAQFRCDAQLLSGWANLGLDGYLAFGPARDAIGARRQVFRCHAIRSTPWCIRMRTALPLIGLCLMDDCDFQSNPTSSH